MPRAIARATFVVPALLLALVLAPGPGLAQQGQVPVLVEGTSPDVVTVSEGENATFGLQLVNLNPERAYFVSVTGDGFSAWSVDAEPNRFVLPANATRDLAVVLVPEGTTPPTVEGTLQVSMVDTVTGAVTTVPRPVVVHVQKESLVLGLFANPLPAPLDNAYGVFLIDIAFWTLVGLVAYFAGDRIVRHLTRYARRDVTRVILAKLRWPLFLFVLALGVRASFGVLPRNVLTNAIDWFLTVIVVGIAGLFLFYRVLDAFITYYEREVAPRTRTKLDDILAPFMRKVMIVVVVLIALGYVLRLAGVDLSVLFAGAGVMGLVIGLAAQESLSNFFGGLFILLDRPFLEGDDLQLDTGEVVRVERIGLRSTKLYNYRDHDMIILPNNALVSGRVTNLTYPDPRFKLNIEVGVAYGSDVEKVKRALHEALADDARIITDDPEEPPVTRFNAFGDSALLFAIRFGVRDYRERWQIATDVRERIDAIFRREGINIPFPQRTVWMKEAPALRVEDARPVAGAAGGEARTGGGDGHGA